MRRRWHPLNTSFLVGTLLLALVAVPLKIAYQGLRWSEVLVCFTMVFAIGTAISAGYHRLFSHRAFKAGRPVRFLLLCLGAASFENSALKWASDHRIHHRHVDTPKDPYPIQRGFWHAHWLWVMEGLDTPLQGVADLEKDPMVMWQHRNHFMIGAVVALIPVFIGIATGNILGHLVMGLIFRIVLTHHTTFLINSAAHVFGSRPYTDANSARDSWVLAPLTYGEGFHNFHHMWQWDYRNGALWYQWDTTKWMLNLLAWAGLVSEFRRVPEASIRRARLAMEEKRLQAKLALSRPGMAEAIAERLAAARVRLDEALNRLHERREAWEVRKAEWKANRASRADQWRAAKAEWKASMAEHRRELREAWREWRDARFEARQVLAYA